MFNERRLTTFTIVMADVCETLDVVGLWSVLLFYEQGSLNGNENVLT